MPRVKKYSSTNPHPFVIEVGKKITALRKAHGISQQKLADHLDITFQQVQKYEYGTNRVPIEKLHKIMRLFGVNSDFFFEAEPNPGEEMHMILVTQEDRRQLMAHLDYNNELFNLMGRMLGAKQ